MVLQVDDDSTCDPDEDEVDMADAGQAAEVEAGSASKMKSVRMDIAGVMLQFMANAFSPKTCICVEPMHSTQIYWWTCSDHSRVLTPYSQQGIV